nr:Chain B, TP53-binding protein 1 peptide [Homo sapiens]7LIO_C Chain C, TP53-binding protein 1 peptide [Homo sapiens]7LIO_D Chain D, TP53-binding protein 1 peptide [Homo sapiens]
PATPTASSSSSTTPT